MVGLQPHYALAVVDWSALKGLANTAMKKLVFRGVPCSVVKTKWDKLFAAVLWYHKLNMMDMLQLVDLTTFTDIKSLKERAGSGQYSFHKIQGASYNQFTKGLGMPGLQTRLDIAGVVMEPLDFVMRYFTKAASLSRRAVHRLEGRPAPISELANERKIHAY